MPPYSFIEEWKMSDVKNSKRKKSRLEAQHMAYAIRKRITAELMASFALSQKRIEAYVESATKGIADISEREVTAKLLRELTMDRNVWFITKERDTVLDLCQGISRQLRMGNTVFPEYYSEFIERRLQLDRAMEYCNALQDELQFIAETIPCDKNKYMNIVLELNKLYNYIKSLRASDNKFLPKIKKNEGNFCSDCSSVVSAAYFANVNSKAPKEADSEFYTDKWERLKDYSLDKEPPKTMKFEDNGEPMFYLERYGTLYVIRKKKKEKQALTPAQEAERQNKRNKKQIKAILKEAANTRKAFIEGILSGRIKKVTNEEKVVAELFEQMMSWETFTGHNTLKEFFLGDKCYNAQKEDIEAAEKKMEGLSVLHKLLCMVSAMVADADLVEWNYTYNTVRGKRVKAFYGILEQYGFQFPNDEEKSVVEGTSDLYVKKEC